MTFVRGKRHWYRLTCMRKGDLFVCRPLHAIAVFPGSVMSSRPNRQHAEADQVMHKYYSKDKDEENEHSMKSYTSGCIGGRKS